LHIIDSSGLYGAEKVILTLLEELRGSEYPGILGCIREKKTEKVEIAERARESGIPTYYFTMKRGLNPLGIYEIVKFIKYNRISLVHSHGYKPNIFLGILFWRHFPVISTVHGWLKSGNDRKGRIYELLDSNALKRLDCLVAVSEAVKKDLVKRGIAIEKIVTIYNGINTEYFQNVFDVSVVKKEYVIDQGDFVIGTAGRLSKEKGHSYLIKAFADLVRDSQRVKLIIAGEGPLRTELEDLVGKLALSNHVRFLGYEKNIVRFLSAIDVFILPSLTEGLPISLLEAMASGKPVIASGVGGIREVIQNNINGIVIPPMDAKAILDSIKFLYHNKEQRTRIGFEGKKHVTVNFSSEDMALAYQNLYSKIISEC
jgi:glycosyltransferase involved in cell wall biosynthesis